MCSSDVLYDALCWSSEEVVRCIVEALAERRRHLTVIASQELPLAVRKGFKLSPDKVIDASARRVYNLLKENNISLPPSLLVPSEWQTIYHLLLQPDDLVSLTKWADIFYDAGFHDFVQYDKHGQNIFMTLPPCWFSTFCETEIPELFLWFLRKGLGLEYKKCQKAGNGDYTPHTPASYTWADS